MPAAFAPEGLLDLTRVKSSRYAALPKALAAFKGRASASRSKVLFEQPPEYDDAAALLGAKPVDQMLFFCFASLLNGLSSGPAQIMGLFRCVNADDVIIRLYRPERPQPGELLDPLYFCVQRGHAELAIKNKWVAPDAPTWLALYAAVYYTYIGDAREFYRRQDLGGPENAAWLVMYGKDCSRADYRKLDAAKAAQESEESAGSGKDSGSGRQSDPAELLKRVLGTAEGDFDKELCTRHIFAAAKDQEKTLTKQWRTSLSGAESTPGTGLRSGLTPAMAGKEAEIRKWLRGRKGLSEDAIGLLLVFLEANQVASAKGKERYARGARVLWEGVQSARRRRIPVAIELRKGDAAIPELLGKGAQGESGLVEVVDACALELPGQGKERMLCYLALHSPEGPGRRFRFEERDGIRRLIQEPHKKGAYWLELDQAMTRASRLFVGGDATAALALQTEGPSFTVALPGQRDAAISWPARR